MFDITGRQIHLDDCVAQRNFYDTEKGAMRRNCNQIGRVQKIPRSGSRVKVVFPTDPLRAMSIETEYLVVVRLVDSKWTPHFDESTPIVTRHLNVRDQYRGEETTPSFRKWTAPAPVVAVVEPVKKVSQLETQSLDKFINTKIIPCTDLYWLAVMEAVFAAAEFEAWDTDSDTVETAARLGMITLLKRMIKPRAFNNFSSEVDNDPDGEKTLYVVNKLVEYARKNPRGED